MIKEYKGELIASILILLFVYIAALAVVDTYDAINSYKADKGLAAQQQAELNYPRR